MAVFAVSFHGEEHVRVELVSVYPTERWCGLQHPPKSQHPPRASHVPDTVLSARCGFILTDPTPLGPTVTPPHKSGNKAKRGQLDQGCTAGREWNQSPVF